MNMFPALVQAWIRIEISTSSDPSHEQMTHVACSGDPIDVCLTIGSNALARQGRRDAFIPPHVIGGKRFSETRNIGSTNPNTSRPYCLTRSRLALYYYTTSINVAFSLHLRRLRTVDIRGLHTAKVQLGTRNFPGCPTFFLELQQGNKQNKHGSAQRYAYNVRSYRLYERCSSSHS